MNRLRLIAFLSSLGLALGGCSRGDSDDPPTPDTSVVDSAQDSNTLPDILPPPDGQRPDGPRPDGAPDGPQDLPPPFDLPGPSPFKLVITEFIANPFAVKDGDGEWIELYNPGSTAIDLAGWTLRDEDAANPNIHTIAGPLSIAPGQYLVLAVKKDSAVNGGVNADYEFATFYLGNGGDEILLLDGSGLLVDRVAYDKSTWSIEAGASLQLRDASLDNNDPANWCLATNTWSGSAGDKGTPGAANDCTGAPDAGPDLPAPEAGPDLPAPDAGPDAPNDSGADAWPPPPTCPPPGTTFQNPPQLGDLEGQTCDYVCWGSGNLYNSCGTNMWQYCLSSGAFAPCQSMP